MNLQHNISLKDYNTFGIEAIAEQFVEVTTIDQLQEVCTEHNSQKLLVLGGGSNVLFTKNVEGLTLKNSISGINIISENANEVEVCFSSGENWHNAVLWAVEKGYGGIENLSLIPGLCGAAPMQNIGAYGVEIKDVFNSLQAVNVKTGELVEFSKADCAFGYRESIFKRALEGQYIICSITLRLTKQPTFNVSYGAIQQTLEIMQVKDLSIKAVSDAVIQIRQSKLPDPKELGNAGSFFKNPEIEQEAFNQLISSYPNAPNYPLPNGKVKVPAGWLIEQCGWKGKRVGNTGAHKNQALVLVNYGSAAGKEIYDLAMEIKQSVKDKFAIEIMPEVNVV